MAYIVMHLSKYSASIHCSLSLSALSIVCLLSLCAFPMAPVRAACVIINGRHLCLCYRLFVLPHGHHRSTDLGKVEEDFGPK